MAISYEKTWCSRACHRTGYSRPEAIAGCDRYLVELHEQKGGAVAPSLTSLLCHWQVARALRGGRLPDRRDFSAEILRPWLGSLVIAEPLATGGFLIRLFGTRVVELVGDDFTGRSTTDLPLSLGQALDRHWTEVLLVQQPRIFDDGVVAFRGHALPVEEVALPIRVYPDGHPDDSLQLIVGFSAPEDPAAFILARLRKRLQPAASPSARQQRQAPQPHVAA